MSIIFYFPFFGFEWSERALNREYGMIYRVPGFLPILSASSTGDTGKTEKERQLSGDKEEGGGGGAKSTTARKPSRL
jgi:hypothetical protein